MKIEQKHDRNRYPHQTQNLNLIDSFRTFTVFVQVIRNIQKQLRTLLINTINVRMYTNHKKTYFTPEGCQQNRRSSQIIVWGALSTNIYLSFVLK